MLLLLLTALQVPPLAAKESVELPELKRVAMTPSRTGKYLVLGESDQLEVRDGESLQAVKSLPGRWTGFGFEETDQRFLVVGDEVILYDTKTWTPVSLGPLKDAGFKPVLRNDPKSPLRPQQAWVTPELDFYYLTDGGDVALATVQNRKVTATRIGLTDHPEGPPTKIHGWYEGGLLLSMGSGQGGISSKTDLSYLVASSGILLLAVHGNLAVGVGVPGETLYRTRTWAYVAKRGGEEAEDSHTNLCAALDSRSGWVYVGDKQGLRAWNTTDFGKVFRYAELKGPVELVGVSPPSLYTLEKTRLRRWAIPP